MTALTLLLLAALRGVNGATGTFLSSMDEILPSGDEIWPCHWMRSSLVGMRSSLVIG